MSALKTKRVTGGQVLAGRLPSRSEAFEEAEQPCRRRFGRRRQVLGRAHTRCGGGASGAMPPVRRGGVSGRGAAGAGGSWAALSTSARSAHGRRPRGRPHASRAALSVPALRGDSDGAAAWRDPSAAFQRDGHRAGVRDIRALRGQSARHARARLTLALGGAGVAGDGPVARCHRARVDLRLGEAVARALGASPSSRARRPGCAGHGPRAGLLGCTRLRGRRAACLLMTAPTEDAPHSPTSLDRRARGP